MSMTITSASGLAFLAVLSVATAASAQSGGFTIAPDDLPKAQAHCRALAAAQTSSLTSNEGAELIEPSPDPASSFSAGASSMDNALTRIDLNRLTVARCRGAGLLR